MNNEIIAALRELQLNETVDPASDAYAWRQAALTAAIQQLQQQREALAEIWQLDAEVNGSDGHGLDCDQRYCQGLSRAADIIDRLTHRVPAGDAPAPAGPMCSENGILGYSNAEIEAMRPAPAGYGCPPGFDPSLTAAESAQMHAEMGPGLADVDTLAAVDALRYIGAFADGREVGSCVLRDACRLVWGKLAAVRKLATGWLLDDEQKQAVVASGDPATTPPTKAFDLGRHDCGVAILAMLDKEASDETH